MQLTEYEKQRNENIKANEARMQSLHLRKLGASVSLLTKRKCSNKQTVCQKNRRDMVDQGSESEYDPCSDKATESAEDDLDTEEDGIGQNVLEEEICKSTRSQAASMAPGSKRSSKTPRNTSDFVQSSSARCTRSQSSLLNSTQVGVNMPRPLNASLAEQTTLNNEVSEGNSTFNILHATIDGNTREDAAQVDSNASATLVARDTPSPKVRDVRKRTMGHGLDKINERQGTRLPIFVPEGKIRPEHPVQAAKLASECGVALRDHLPIYPHWKDYKKVHTNDSNEGSTTENIDHISKVLGVVATRLAVDVNHDGPSKDACEDIVKRGIRQQRYKLKKKYFDGKSEEQIRVRGPPPNVERDDWAKLLQKWNDPRHKENCEKNKENRGQVKLHQRTGSRCYIAHRYSLRAKYQNREPNAIEFFGECMTSSKKGCTELAKQVIDKMESERQCELVEGEEPKSPTQIAAETLSQVSSKSQFLPNMGIPLLSKKSRPTASAAQIEIRLQAEREEAARIQGELLHRIASQEAALSSNQAALDFTKEQLDSTKEEVRQMRLRQAETDMILRRLLEERDSRSNA